MLLTNIWIPPSCHIYIAYKKPGAHLFRWYQRVPHFILLWQGADWSVKSERAMIGHFQKTRPVGMLEYGILVCSQTLDNLIRDWMR